MEEEYDLDILPVNMVRLCKIKLIESNNCDMSSISLFCKTNGLLKKYGSVHCILNYERPLGLESHVPDSVHYTCTFS